MYMNKMNINCSYYNLSYVHKAGKQELKKIGVSKKYSQYIFTCLVIAVDKIDIINS